MEAKVTNERTVAELYEKWAVAEPFYYDLDHEGAGILFKEIARLRQEAKPDEPTPPRVGQVLVATKLCTDPSEQAPAGWTLVAAGEPSVPLWQCMQCKVDFYDRATMDAHNRETSPACFTGEHSPIVAYALNRGAES
jgi:hypothetical protein